MDIVIRSTDLFMPENAHQLYEGLRGYEIETRVNNAGFGNYDSVADQLLFPYAENSSHNQQRM